jgi:TonB family protein
LIFKKMSGKNYKLISTLLLVFCCSFLVSGQSMTDRSALPQFPGGQQALAKFIYSNMHYPDKAQMLGITGLVKVRFTVLPTGKIVNAHILKDIGGGCGAEAMRLVSLMPKWKSGKVNNKPARIEVTLPIIFDLKERKLGRKKISRKEKRRLRKEKKKKQLSTQ